MKHLIEILSLTVALNVFWDNVILGPVWIYHAINMRSFFTITSRAT